MFINMHTQAHTHIHTSAHVEYVPDGSAKQPSQDHRKIQHINRILKKLTRTHAHIEYDSDGSAKQPSPYYIHYIMYDRTLLQKRPIKETIFCTRDL